jgi:hypothetical protein
MTKNRFRRPAMAIGMAVMMIVVGSVLSGPSPASAGPRGAGWLLLPGKLLVSTSIYDDQASNVLPGQVLPPGCTSGCATATNDGLYPQVFNNDQVDASFGVTSRIVLNQMTLGGTIINSMEVPTDQLVTSFSSKSELALNLSTDGRSVTFMGYAAPVDALDVSNSNTPGVIDPTNPVPGAYYRAVAEMDQFGHLHYTLTNAYSGNNGRAAALNNRGGANRFYMAGNAGNGSNPQPTGVIIGAGAQTATPQILPETAQHPGLPAPVGSFSIAELGDKLDKVGKDTNFRGLTISGNVLYTTKGSGGNGVNTVYFVDTTGHACPHGSGLPASGVSLPAGPLAYDPSVVQTQGLTPTNMCILQGFPTELKSTTFFPFGVWLANPTTMYVTQEGNGDNTYSASTGTYTAAATQTGSGLQKWVLVGGTWQLAYTVASGLDLGMPYSAHRYPKGTNPATGLPWAPATDGLRNLTGRVNGDGTVTIWAVTSTVSGSGDQGADPNRLVTITDHLAATAPSAHDEFRTLHTAASGEVVRGVSLTPGS